MPSPFPGMDPYLETPDLWADVHHELISQIRSALNPLLRPAYVARVELRVYGLLDKEIKEARLEIRHRASGSLVAVIEVLSPSNKVRGSSGRASFLAKRQDILLTEDVHWIEIDLLRAGVPSLAKRSFRECDYRILVSWADRRLRAQFWPVSVRQGLPAIGIPLRQPDPDVPLDLQAVLNAAYDDGGYDLSIDYGARPDPPLYAADASWAKKLLKKQGS